MFTTKRINTINGAPDCQSLAWCVSEELGASHNYPSTGIQLQLDTEPHQRVAENKVEHSCHRNAALSSSTAK